LTVARVFEVTPCILDVTAETVAGLGVIKGRFTRPPLVVAVAVVDYVENGRGFGKSGGNWFETELGLVGPLMRVVGVCHIVVDVRSEPLELPCAVLVPFSCMDDGKTVG
jgi:hypothetical protein